MERKTALTILIAGLITLSVVLAPAVAQDSQTDDEADKCGGDHGGCHTDEIPEYPTIALPVLGILGLLFVYSRRRKRTDK